MTEQPESTKALRNLETTLRVRTRRRFEGAIAALRLPPSDPPPTQAELLGRAVRSFNDAMKTFAREFRSGSGT